MQRHRLWGLGFVLLASGCSWLPLGNDRHEPTVGSLQDRHEWPAPAPLPMADSRQAAMSEYQSFLADAQDPELVPEAMRRLADLQLDVEQEQLQVGVPVAGGAGSRAAALYEELLRRYPDHPHSDTSLYQMARALEQHADPQPAMAALSHYAERYQGTERYDEVQFRRGEYLFVQRRYAEAEQAYQAVLEQGADSVFHQQALYKIGWARFKQNQYEPALNAYLQLFDETIADHDRAELPATLERIDRERIEDTLRAVSLCFVYLGDTQEISRYFAAHGGRRYEPMLYAHLATLHLAKERYSDAADTYRLFADMHAQHREAPLFQSRVIDVYNQAGFQQRVLEEKQAFVERYEPAGDYWQGHDPAQSPELLDQVQRHLRDIARHYHAQAQQRKTPQAVAEAGRWYQLYLRAFSASEQAPLMNFLYAELLTGAGEHGRAAEQYEQTAYGYAGHGKAAEAGYAALLAYERHEVTLQGQARQHWHRSGIESALRFATTFPAHEQAWPARTRAAQQLFALQEYVAAITAAEPLVQQAAVPPALQRAAWQVIAHARFERADYLRAEAAYQQLLARMAANEPARTGLQEKLAASIYRQGEAARDAGDLEAAAGHFLRIATTVPQSAFNVTAQYDAAAVYIQLQRWPEAIRILEQWRQQYPRHELQAEVTRKLAVLYSENAQPLQAAAEFTRMADSEPSAELRREAAWTAATLFRKSGHGASAAQAYRRFVQEYPSPLEPAMEARQQLVELYAASGEPDKQRYWQRQIIDADHRAGDERSDRTRYLAAHARLALVEDALAAYQAVALREPLQKNLAAKKRHMETVIQGYTQAAQYQVLEVTTQASYQLAMLYSDFGQALMQSERPRNLQGEELEQYQILLEEQAYPFEEKAIAVHETNAHRTVEGVYDAWVQQSLQQLAQLLPARYARPERSETFVQTLP